MSTLCAKCRRKLHKPKPTPEQKLRLIERRRKIKAIIRLSQVERLTQREIAARVGVSQGWVCRQLVAAGLGKTGWPRRRKTVPCRVCGKPFTYFSGGEGRNRAGICSRECHRVWMSLAHDTEMPEARAAWAVVRAAGYRKCNHDVIYWRDKDRTNNSLDNLLVFRNRHDADSWRGSNLRKGCRGPKWSGRVVLAARRRREIAVRNAAARGEVLGAKGRFKPKSTASQEPAAEAQESAAREDSSHRD